MDFKSLKYSGQNLWTAVTLVVAATWIVGAEYWGFKHRIQLQELKQSADHAKAQALIDLKVDFLLGEIGTVNGRVDKKTARNLEYFKTELDKLSDDQLVQWEEINRSHK